MKTLIKNCKVFGKPDADKIYIDGEKFSAAFDEKDADKVIDLKGATVVPGLVDMHCHLREPGFEYKETIATGTASAAKGGYTSICPMPNTKPVADNAAVISGILKKAKEAGCAVVKIGIVEENMLLKKWYESFGFKHTGCVKYDFFPFTCGYMEREI